MGKKTLSKCVDGTVSYSGGPDEIKGGKENKQPFFHMLSLTSGLK
jgi:hypothetical protein